MQLWRIASARTHHIMGFVLQTQGRCAGAYNNLAIALGAESRFGEAITNYRQALSLEPYLADAHYNLANVLREQHRYEEAITRYNRAIELRADHETLSAEPGGRLGLGLQERCRGTALACTRVKP